jgi:4-amino-4-deoxy-L-arabinose transferase-like glycosyltransferase
MRAPRSAGIAGIALVTAAAAGLRLGFAFKSIAPNPFYDAAVRSMGMSWHNFFYGAFEPGGSVSIDKAPADLWFQVLSVKLLGFSSTALRLPEALAGTAAVALLYALVARLFGRAAGLIAAAALAVMPVAVVTARSDTMDSLMMALLVAAALLTVRSAQAGRAPLAAGAALGLAFNVKLFEAAVPVPAIALLYVLVADGPLRTRAGRLLAGGALFAAAALAWVTVAGLASLSHRPYPIGSSNGGVWDVVFGFNGIHRLTHPLGAEPMDPSGPLRLFGATGPLYGSLIGTELVAALVLGALAWLLARGELTGTRARRAGVIAFGTWLVLGAGLFSAMRALHPRYLEAMTPAVAAVLGVAVAVLARRSAVVLAAGVVAAVVIADGFAHAPPGGAELAALGAVAACMAVRWRTRLAPVAAALALLALPAGTALRLAEAGASDSGRPGYTLPAQTIRLSRYLQAHTRGLRYELASSSAAPAGPLIVRDGRPVMMLTRPFGRQLTPPGTVERAVASGQLRYALIARSTCRRCTPSVRWAIAHGTDVSRRVHLPRGSLYRLWSTRAVSSSAGKNASIESSETVTSTAVPNVV